MKKCPYCNRAMPDALARRSEELDRLRHTQRCLKQHVMELSMAERATKSRSMKRHLDDKITSAQKNIQQVERALKRLTAERDGK